MAQILLVTLLATVSVVYSHGTDTLTVLSAKYPAFFDLLGRADLLQDVDSLSRSERGLTILPVADNHLFARMNPSKMEILKDRGNKAYLRKILSNHLIPRTAKFGEFDVEETVGGDTVSTQRRGGVRFVENAAVDHIDVALSARAVAHSVKALITPRSLEEYRSLSRSGNDVQGKGSSRRELSSPSSPSIAIDYSDTPSVIIYYNDTTTGAPISSTPSSSPSPSLDSFSSLMVALSLSGNYSTFVNYLYSFNEIDFLEFLASLYSITVMAPSDYAFSLIPYDTLQRIVDTPKFYTVLDYHILYYYNSLYDFETGDNALYLVDESEFGKVYAYSTPSSALNVTVGEFGYLSFGPEGAVITETIFDDTINLAYGIDKVMIPPEFVPIEYSPPPPPYDAEPPIPDYVDAAIPICISSVTIQLLILFIMSLFIALHV